MKVILVPGYWLDASSWDLVTPALEEAGHETVALTLPGMDSPDADRSGISLEDHVAAVVAAVDSFDDPVALVGSSFAGTLVQIAADARPEAIALAVYVDAMPQPLDEEAGDEPSGDEIPFSWDKLSDDEQRHLTDAQRASFEQRAIPFPAKVVRDGWRLTDPRRHGVRSLIIATGFTTADLDEWRDQYPEVGAELDAHTRLTLVELPTSHWPHLTRPGEFTRLLLDALD